MDLNEIDDRKELEKEIIEVTIKAMVEANPLCQDRCRVI